MAKRSQENAPIRSHHRELAFRTAMGGDSRDQPASVKAYVASGAKDYAAADALDRWAQAFANLEAQIRKELA